MPKPPKSRKAPLCSIDLPRFKVLVNGSPVILTPKEFRVFSALVMAKGKVLSRQDLLELVFESDGARDIYSRTIDQHISRMRVKLGEAATVLRTVAGEGYQVEGVTLSAEKETWGRVEKISRFFPPEKIGAKVLLVVEGSVLQNLQEGQLLALPA